MSIPAKSDAAEVVAQMDSHADNGLTTVAASSRLAIHGVNELKVEVSTPLWRKAIAQFSDPLVLLLLAAIGISFLAWLLEGADGIPFEAVIIAIIVLANAVIGLWQEAKAEAAVAALQRMAAPHARVIRDGEVREIAAADVVPGDLLVLGEGDAVVADARLISVSSLRVAEAPLTGESEPVLKHVEALADQPVVGDQTNMVFSGTAITSGTGRAVVTSTAMATEIGRIAQLLGETEDDSTPLQKEIELVGRVLGIAVVLIAVIVSVTILLTSEIRSGSDLVEVLLVGVSLAVAAVPEGLPAILAVVLALGVQRMADKNAIVKKLSSVETLGSATVICSDKTGTLTKNEMTIRQIVSASGMATVSGIGYRPEGQVLVDGAPLVEGPLLEEVQLILGGGSLANDASTREEDGEWTITGDPTEAAFLVAEAKFGISELRRARFRRLANMPFTSERKLMTSVEVDCDDEEHPLVVTKGAPDVLLGRCTHERVNGAVHELTDDRRTAILDAVDEMGDQALRTLAVAYRRLGDQDELRRLTEAERPTEDGLEERLVYLGAVGIIDPPRPEATQAVAEAKQAGIRVVMITGDHPRTAATIAEQLGIAGASEVITGKAIQQMNDQQFAESVRHNSVFARVAPEHKLRIVQSLQADGNIVAMTGDGVNDAPALKAAEIGVAMGITGTEVSKEAANMILADDNFATILTAVSEGRSIFSSIRKFLRYLLSSNMGEVLTMFIGVVAAGMIGLDATGENIAVPLLATHILWINLLTDAAPALALGVDPPAGNTMTQAPRKITDRIIDREMQAGVVVTGFVMALATLLALDIVMVGGLFEASGGLELGRTAAFTTLVLAQLFNAFASRSARISVATHLFSNWLLWAAVALSLGLQVAVVHTPFLNTAFQTTPLSMSQWLLCALLASSVLVIDEIKKWALRVWARRVLGDARPLRPLTAVPYQGRT